MKPKSIILFDGVCNLCNKAVQFIIRHDKNGYYSFASLQSDFAKELLSKFGNRNDLKSIVLIEGEYLFIKSTAVLKICRHLSGGWKSAQVFLLVPRFIRDAVYDIIARNRYRWFGKRKECMLPSEELKKRFLS